MTVRDGRLTWLGPLWDGEQGWAGAGGEAAADVQVGLGTDGAVINNNLNPWEALR